jgi:hypothetical protein
MKPIHKPTNIKLSNAQMIQALAELGGVNLSRERLRHFRGYKRGEREVPATLARGPYWDYQNGRVVWDAMALAFLLDRYGRAHTPEQLKEYLAGLTR